MVVEEQLDSRIALNSWTLGKPTVAEMVEVASTAGYAAIELRAADFDLSSDREADCRHLLASGLLIVTLGAKGVLVQPTAADQSDWFATLAETAALARRIGCPTLMVSTGMENGTAIGEASALLGEAGRVAEAHGLTVAYEFNAFHPVFNSLPVALDIVGEAAHTAVGLALDAYHLQRSGGFDLLTSIPRDRLFAIQISDVPKPDAAARPPLDRIMPGDGTADWRHFFAAIDASGFAGAVSFEAPNPAHWQAEPVALAEAARQRIAGLWQASRSGATE